MGKQFDLSILLKVIDKATQPLKNFGGVLGRAQKAIGKMHKSMDKLGKQADRIGKQMSLKLTLPILGLEAAAFKASTNLNEMMANVATLIPGNIKRVEALKKEVQSLSIEVGKSSTDISGGLFQVISAFGDSADAVDQLRVASRAGVAGLSSTKEAINLLSAVTKGYGDTSTEALQKAANLAFKTNELGQTTFPELASAMGRVIPLAATLKVSQEELFAVMATMTGVTGNTAEVSTQAAAALRAFIKPTDLMTKAVKFLGHESPVTMVKTIGLVNSLAALKEIAKGDELVLGQLFGRAEALQTVFSLTGKQADTFKEKLSKMSDVVGAQEKAFKEQTKGINKAGFKFKQVTLQVVQLAQSFGDALAPAIMEIISLMTPVIKWFTNLSKGTKTVILALATLLAILGPLAIGIGFLVTVMGSLSAASLPITASILVVAAALATVGTLIALIINDFEIFKQLLMDISGLSFITDLYAKVKGSLTGETKRREGRQSAGMANLANLQAKSETKVTIEVKGKDGASAQVVGVKGDAPLEVINDPALVGAF